MCLWCNSSYLWLTKYSHYKIVVVQGSNTSNTKTEIPDNQLLSDSQSKNSYYVAAAFMLEDFNNIFLIGDGQSYTLNDKTYMNAPLSADKEYSVFIRLYSELQVSWSHRGMGKGMYLGPTSLIQLSTWISVIIFHPYF